MPTKQQLKAFYLHKHKGIEPNKPRTKVEVWQLVQTYCEQRTIHVTGSYGLCAYKRKQMNINGLSIEPQN